MFEYPNVCKTPVMIQRFQFFMRPYEFMEFLRQTYGDLFTLKINPKGPMVYVGDPQAIQKIFSIPPDRVDVGKANWILKSLLGTGSMLLLDGKPHQRHRKLLTPPFHGERMKSYGKLTCEITDIVTDNWETNKSFDVRSSMKDISLQVILEAIFGLHQGERYDRIKDLLCSLLELPGSPLGISVFIPFLQKDFGKWSPWGRYLHQRQQLDELLYAEIQERKNNPDPSREDVLSLMITARDEDGEAMTYEELRDHLITLLFAGHEMTATALSWALYWIHRLPEVKQKLLQELDEVDENESFTELTKLPYLNGVCCETLRIYPVMPVAFSRILKTSTRIMDYEFPEGTVLSPCVYLLHHREDLYPDSKRFKPERFIERQYSPYEFIPFGGGNRRCIGMAFSMFQMKIILAKVMKKFDLAFVNNSVVKPRWRGMAVAPCGGNWLVANGKRESIKEPVVMSK